MPLTDIECSSKMPSRTVIFVVLSSRTDLCDDVVDVTSLSALDVVEIQVIFVVFVVPVGTRRSRDKTFQPKEKWRCPKSLYQERDVTSTSILL